MCSNWKKITTDVGKTLRTELYSYDKYITKFQVIISVFIRNIYINIFDSVRFDSLSREREKRKRKYSLMLLFFFCVRKLLFRKYSDFDSYIDINYTAIVLAQNILLFIKPPRSYGCYMLITDARQDDSKDTNFKKLPVDFEIAYSNRPHLRRSQR